MGAILRYRIDDLIVDAGRRSVERNGAAIELPALSFDLLLTLVQAAPDLVSAGELNERVWPGLVVSPETISQRVKLLRAALGDPATTPRYIGTARGRGYRMVAPVTVMTESPVPMPAAVESGTGSSEPEPGSPPFLPRRLALVAVLACLLAAVAAWFVLRVDRGTGPGIEATTRLDPSVAVLPLVSRGKTAEDVALADSIHGDILSRLAQVDGVRVIAGTSVERFRAASRDVRDIGTQLGVGTVLEGSVQRDGSRVRVNLQLVDVVSGSNVWARNFDRELNAGELFALQSEIAESVAAELRPMLDPAARARLRTAPTTSLEAWQDLQAARRIMASPRAASLLEARRLLERAIAADPRFAVAHAFHADALFLLSTTSQGDADALRAASLASIDRALQLAPDDPDVLIIAAWMAQDRGDFETALNDFKRALASSPSHARASAGYALLLSELGRPQEAVAYAEAALRLDPLSLETHRWLAAVYQDAGRPQDALRVALRVLELDPTSAEDHVRIGALFARTLGRPDLGLPWIERAAMLDPGDSIALNWLMMLNADLGRFDEMRRWMLALEQAEKGRARVWRALQPDASGTITVDTEHLQPPFASGAEADSALAAQTHVDLAAGRLAQARSRYERLMPAWMSAAQPVVTARQFQAALGYAETLRRSGDKAGAARLAAAVAERIRGLTRLGPNGYGLADVGVHAVRGETEAALDALEAAQRSGWIGPAWRFERDVDPALDAIRGTPRFRAVFQHIEADMKPLRARLESRPSGEPLPTALD